MYLLFLAILSILKMENDDDAYNENENDKENEEEIDYPPKIPDDKIDKENEEENDVEKEQEKEEEEDYPLKLSDYDNGKNEEEINYPQKIPDSDHFVYFIESHNSLKTINVSLSPNYIESRSLERIEETTIKKDKKKYVTSLYHFCIYKLIKKKDVIIIKAQDNLNEDMNQISISELNPSKNAFLFDINSSLNLYDSKLDLNDEFNFYLTYLEENYEKKSEQYQDLIESVLNYIANVKKKEKIDFSFYITLFVESFQLKYFYLVLELFHYDRINQQRDSISQKYINNFKNIAIAYENDPNLPDLQDEAKKEQLTINLFTLIYYFIYKYDKSMLKNLVKPNTYMFIYKGLIKHRQFFPRVKLSKKIINKLVNFSNDYIDLINALSYNRDLLVLLEVINENIDFINQKIDGKNELINLEILVEIKKDDNLNLIYGEIIKLFSHEKKLNKKFAIISQNIFDKYINYFNTGDDKNLNLLNSIIKDITNNNQEYEINNDMQYLIYKKNLKLALEHKLTNIDILHIIKEDKFFNEEKYNSKEFRQPEILSGIDIYKINEEFFSLWKKINFEKVFENNYYDYVDQVCKLVDNMSYFGILFELLNKSKDNNRRYDYNSISLMQSTFTNLLKTYVPENCKNFKNDIINLIYYSDQEKFNINKFLKETIEKNINDNLLNEIYSILLIKHEFLSNVAIDIIADFFTQDIWKANINKIIQLINLSNKIKKIMWNKLNKFVINENEFFEVEETNNYNLLLQLLKSNNFKQDENNLEAGEYLERSMIVITGTEEKIKNLDINYNLITYFIDNKKDEILYNRLLTIFLLNEKDANEQKDILKKNVKVIKLALNNLRSYLDKVTLFFPNKYYNEIKEVNEVIKKIKLGTINDYLKKYSYDYNKYTSIFREDIEKIGKRAESYFFITIYNDVKNKYKLDDEKNLKKAIKHFEKMKDIFSKNKLADSNDKIVEMCLRPFENREDELKHEIDIDIELLKIQNIKDKFKLYEDMLMLLKRKKILNVTLAFQTFINQMRLVRTVFSKDLEHIIKSLQESKVKYIKKTTDILEKYNINIDKKEEYLNIILLIQSQPTSIDFLLRTTIEDCRALQELPGLFENGFLSIGDIIDLENCINFMKIIGNGQTLKTMKDIDLINKFREEVGKNQKISLNFTKFINNFAIMEDMMINGLDRAEMSKNKVNSILEKSEFTISNIYNRFFTCLFWEYSRNNRNELTPSYLEFKDLFDLRDRAQLNRIMGGIVPVVNPPNIDGNNINAPNQNGNNIDDGNEQEKVILKNKKFIELVSEINNIYGLLQEIYWKGFTKEVIVKINIDKNNIVYNIEKKDYNSFNDVINIIKDIFNKIKEHQIIGYKNKKLVRYFFGLQFNYFYKIINEPRQKHLNKLMPFLNYFTNELIKENLDSFSYKKTKNEYQDIINNCDRYLSEILKKNKISYYTIYQYSLIRQKAIIGKYKGIYTYLSESLEKEIFQIFKYLTKINPVAQNILLCNKDTTSEEIIAFLYRAILCEYNSCFIIGGVETLIFDKKNNFFNLINSLYVENYKKMRSCLIILYTNKTSDIYKWLELEKTVKKLDIVKTDYENEKYNGKEIEIIYSDKSGVGKSVQIKCNILFRNKQYIYFPFGGVLNRDQILTRLKNLEINDNSVLHLDLYDTNSLY